MAEKPDVWFPLMVSAYLKKTMGLNAEQHGAYLLLLISYWVSGPPPDDDGLLAGIACMDARQWRRTRPVLLRYFHIEDGYWRQDRADEELARWGERKRRFAERASAGGRAKAAKSSATSSAKPLLTGCTPSPSKEVEEPKSSSTLFGRGRARATRDAAHDRAEAETDAERDARMAREAADYRAETEKWLRERGEL